MANRGLVGSYGALDVTRFVEAIQTVQVKPSVLKLTAEDAQSRGIALVVPEGCTRFPTSAQLNLADTAGDAVASTTNELFLGRAYLRIGSRCIVKYADGILAQEHEVVDCIEHASFLARDFKSISLCLRPLGGGKALWIHGGRLPAHVTGVTFEPPHTEGDATSAEGAGGDRFFYVGQDIESRQDPEAKTCPCTDEIAYIARNHTWHRGRVAAVAGGTVCAEERHADGSVSQRTYPVASVRPGPTALADRAWAPVALRRAEGAVQGTEEAIVSQAFYPSAKYKAAVWQVEMREGLDNTCPGVLDWSGAWVDGQLGAGGGGGGGGGVGVSNPARGAVGLGEGPGALQLPSSLAPGDAHSG